jgi:IclR family mhp operon transcriptional activator
MPDVISSIKRGLQTLTLLNGRPSLSASELCIELKISRTSARRVLDTLVEEGYVDKPEGEGRYRLTAVVKALSSGLHDESAIARAAEPVLARRALEIGWRLTLATPVGTNMIVRVSTARLARRSRSHDGPDVGFRTPMLHGTSGYVMLAFMRASVRDRLLRMLEKSPDPRQSIARDQKALLSSLNRVQRDGFAHRRYLEYPEASLGVPIFHNGVVRACLLMSYTKNTLTRRELCTRFVPLLWDLAETIERRASGYDFVSRPFTGFPGREALPSGRAG